MKTNSISFFSLFINVASETVEITQHLCSYYVSTENYWLKMNRKS